LLYRAAQRPRTYRHVGGLEAARLCALAATGVGAAATEPVGARE
jgi:hypothetical protein